MSNKITLAQILARTDNEIRTVDAAQVVHRAGLILEAQLEKNKPWFRVQAVKNQYGLVVQVCGAWHKAHRVVFYRTLADYNTAFRQRSSNG